MSYKLETVGEYKDRLETAIKEGTCLDDDEDEDEEKKEKEEDKLIPAAISTNQDVLITAAQMHTAKQAKKLAKADVTDKQREKERIKEKKRAKKLKEKELRRGEVS